MGEKKKKKKEKKKRKNEDAQKFRREKANRFLVR